MVSKPPNIKSFEDILAMKKVLVWREVHYYLERVLRPSIKKYSQKFSEVADFHYNLVKEYPQRRGKYLRPSLLLLTCEAMGGSQKKALKLAAAMQISEDWLLIHDDLEDSSEERRGKLTLHRQYSAELAINAGDSLHVLMWKMVFDGTALFNKEIGAKLVNEFFQILTRTTLGQSVEIKWTQENKVNLTDNDWFFIADGKTAYYTIAGPMRLGAIIAGATDQQLEFLFRFGTNLGRCFQIVDDILDVTSDFNGLKKQRGNDIYEGKRTLILIHLFRKASGSDLKKLKAVFNKKREDRDEHDVSLVINLMGKYGSIEYARDVADGFARLAREIFDQKLRFLRYEPSRTYIEHGIDFILNRDF